MHFSTSSKLPRLRLLFSGSNPHSAISFVLSCPVLFCPVLCCRIILKRSFSCQWNCIHRTFSYFNPPHFPLIQLQGPSVFSLQSSVLSPQSSVFILHPHSPTIATLALSTLELFFAGEFRGMTSPFLFPFPVTFTFTPASSFSFRQTSSIHTSLSRKPSSSPLMPSSSSCLDFRFSRLAPLPGAVSGVMGLLAVRRAVERSFAENLCHLFIVAPLVGVFVSAASMS